MSSAKKGATAVEYGLMAMLISLVIILALTLLVNNLLAFFNAAAQSV